MSIPNRTHFPLCLSNCFPMLINRHHLYVGIFLLCFRTLSGALCIPLKLPMIQTQVEHDNRERHTAVLWLQGHSTPWKWNHFKVSLAYGCRTIVHIGVFANTLTHASQSVKVQTKHRTVCVCGCSVPNILCEVWRIILCVSFIV